MVIVRVRSHLIGVLHVIAVFDATVDKLASNPSNAEYVHHDMQNDIFTVTALLIWWMKVKMSVKRNRFW